jgi:xanthine dehydrogenase small subunit
MNSNIIASICLSAGGVAPIPLFLKNTSGYLTGQELNEANILKAIDIVQTEIAPIDDVRGTARYKRLLLAQLIKAHFITLFPFLNAEKLINHLPQRT